MVGKKDYSEYIKSGNRICRDCYIYTQKLEGLAERLVRIIPDAARFYEEGITKTQVGVTNNLYLSLKAEWIWMVSLRKFKCTTTRCLFVDYHFGVGRNTQLSFPWIWK